VRLFGYKGPICVWPIPTARLLALAGEGSGQQPGVVYPASNRHGCTLASDNRRSPVQPRLTHNIPSALASLSAAWDGSQRQKSP
jgi:hypothetical protein